MTKPILGLLALACATALAAPVAARTISYPSSGMRLREGAVQPSATGTASTAGPAVPAQPDVPSTASDGSARRASMTLLAQAPAAGASVPDTRAHTTSSSASYSSAALLAQDNATGTQTIGLAVTGGSTDPIHPARGFAVQEKWTSDNDAVTDARFTALKQAGFTDVKVIAAWSQIENTYSAERRFTALPILHYVERACAAGLHVRLVVDTISGEPLSFFQNNPNSQLVDATGHVDSQYLQSSYWLPNQRTAVHHVTVNVISQLAADAGIPAGCIDEIGPSYGTAGENLYPSSGYTTLQQTPYVNPSFWAYDANALVDFQNRMQSKYGTIAAANGAWGTSFSSFPTTPHPAGTPGAAYAPTAAMWTDFLYWYRNTKRDFAAWQVQDTLNVIQHYFPTNTPAFSVPLPGLHLTPEQFDASVANQGATDAAQDDSIVSYTDNEFIVDLAHQNVSHGLALHLVSLPNNPEASYIKGYEQATYGGVIAMTGENNGHDNLPVAMTDNEQAFNLLQLDVVDDSDLFTSDHQMLSTTGIAFANAIKAVKAQFAGTTPYKQVYTQSDHAFILQAGTCIPVDPAGVVKACLSRQGQFQIIKSGIALWTNDMSPSTYACASGVPYDLTCAIYYAGSLYETDNASVQIWNSGNTDPHGANLLILNDTAPYMHIEDGSGNTVWTTGLAR